MSVFVLILKILGCAVGLYFVAAFIVSFKRLLPFLTLITSIATIVSIEHLSDHPDARSLVWIPIVLSLAMRLFYCGDGYMNPSIVENTYRVVSVERKWNSLFADDDDYVVYLAPAEIGGFFENTFLGGLVFWFFYAVFLLDGGNDMIAYIPAMYHLGMSVVEILLVLGNRFGLFSDFPTLLYWIARIAVIVAALIIGFTAEPLDFSRGGGFSRPTKEDKQLYEECAEFVRIDYAESYMVDTGTGSIGSDYPLTHFAYGSHYDVGAYYEKTEDDRVYYKIFATDPRLGAPACFLKEENSDTIRFSSFVTKTKNHPFPFEPDSYAPYTQYNIPALCEFTLQKVQYAKKVERDTENGLLQIVYDSRDDQSSEQTVDHQVTFSFNISKEGDPWSLNSISCKIFDSSKEYTFTYAPLRDSYALSTLFVFGDLTLENYEPGSEVDYFYTAVEQAAKQAVLDAKGAVGQYDFTVEAWLKDTRNNLLDEAFYYYDAKGEVTAEYADSPYGTTYRDFILMPPDRFIANRYSTVYDGSYTPLPSDAPFVPFTGDNPIVSQGILHAFDGRVSFWKHDVSAGDQFVSVCLDIDYDTFGEGYDAHDYIVYLKQTESGYVPTSIVVNFTYSEWNDWGRLTQTWHCSMELFFENCYDIPAPFH